MVFLAWVGFMSGLSGCQLVSSDGYGAQCDFTGFYRVLPTTIGPLNDHLPSFIVLDGEASGTAFISVSFPSMWPGFYRV